MSLRIVSTVSVLAALGFLGACQTIPYADRVAAYEAEIKTRFVGKAADELVLSMGPPDSTYKLSDGREVFQYESDREIVRGGDTYTDWVSHTRWRTVRNSDGSRSQVPATVNFPVVRTTPVYSEQRVCINRFVVDVNSTVEDFRWEGNACF